MYRGSWNTSHKVVFPGDCHINLPLFSFYARELICSVPACHESSICDLHTEEASLGGSLVVIPNKCLFYKEITFSLIFRMVRTHVSVSALSVFGEADWTSGTRFDLGEFASTFKEAIKPNWFNVEDLSGNERFGLWCLCGNWSVFPNELFKWWMK